MLYRSRPLMVALISSALASAFIFACSSEEEEPNEPGVGGTSSTAAGSTSKGGGTAKGGTTGVGNGGTTTGKGGSAPTSTAANGGSSPGAGGSGVGGSVGPVAGNAGRGSNNQSSCVQGVNTGDNCNASIDTTECVRSTRTCTCSAQTQKWACTPNGVGGAGNGGNSGRGGSAGAPANIAGNAGLAGFAGAGLPVAASCRRNAECTTEGQFCDKSTARFNPRTCTCTNGTWDCIML